MRVPGIEAGFDDGMASGSRASWWSRLPSCRLRARLPGAPTGRPRRSARLWSLAALACVWAGPLATGAHAFCRLSTGNPKPGKIGECSISGAPLAWRERCVSYSVIGRERQSPAFDDDSFDIRDAIDASFGGWMEVQCDGQPLAVSLQQTIPLGKCDVPQHNSKGFNANSIAFVEDWLERGHPENAYGITVLVFDTSSGEILDADMQINETAGTIGFCRSQCGGDGVDLQNVVTHEVGHFLGLGHSDIVNASMYGNSLRGEVGKGFLNEDDVEGACAIYGGLEAPDCRRANFAPRNGWSPDCSDSIDDCSVGRVGGSSKRSGNLATGLLLVLTYAHRRRRLASRRNRV